MKIKHCYRTSLAFRIFFAVAIAFSFVACGGGSPGTSPHVAIAPTILTQPSDQTVAAIGATATFSVVASGDAPLSYQWKRDGVDILGATGASYILNNVTSADANSTWSVVVRNAVGSVASNNVKLKLSGITVLAGWIGGYGNIDGVGDLARFAHPQGFAVDGAGNVYVADTGNHTIRKVTPAGLVTTVAGTPGIKGFVDGLAATARFDSPKNLAVDGAGNVYVADFGNQTIRKISAAGVVTSLAGTPGVPFFSYSVQMAVDLAGNVYMSDYQAIRKISPAGLVTTLAGSPGVAGYADGQGSDARFAAPGGIVVDAAGNVYVADTYNFSIRKISVSGLVTTLFGNPECANISIYLRTGDCLVGPSTLALDGVGNIYAAFAELYHPGNPMLLVKNSFSNVNTQRQMATTSGNVSFESRQSKGSIRKISPSGQMTTLTENINVGIQALDGVGNGYATNSFEIYKFSSSGLLTKLAGNYHTGGTEDGLGTSARFYYIGAVTVNKTGTVYVTDTTYSNTIRKIDPAGLVTTLAGNPIAGSMDGLGIAASFNGPHGIAVDRTNNVYVADMGNYTIRKISPDGLVTTLAGTSGISALNFMDKVDGQGAAATFFSPSSLAVDDTGNIYVGDVAIVRKITPAGLVTTLAGNKNRWGDGTGSVDGLGVAAGFTIIGGLAVDGKGNVYVTDTPTNTIRKIDPSGMVTTFAGSQGTVGSADGFGAAARFNQPTCVAVDSAGNVYVFDSGNFTIRKISPTGMVSTLAGKVGSIGILPGSLPGSLISVKGLAVDSDNIVYAVTDFSVLKITQN